MIWHHFVEITITFLTLRFLKKRRKNPCVFVYLLLFFITEQRYLVTLVYGSLQKRQNSPETPVHLTCFDVFELVYFLKQRYQSKIVFGIFVKVMAIYENKPTELHKRKMSTTKKK